MALMVTRGAEVRPVSLALAQFFGTPPPVWGDVMAFSVLMSAPFCLSICCSSAGSSSPRWAAA